jgi:hypothetical protein
VVAEQAPVLPHAVLVMSFGQAVAQQMPADPVALALTQLPLAQSDPLLGPLAVLQACPLEAFWMHWPLTHE